MKKVIVILLSSFLLFSAFSEDEKLPRLAVVEFSINDSNNQKLVNDSVAVRNQVQSNIVKTGRYDVIARQEIDKLLENQKIQVSSISSSENIKKFKLLNIDYLITGTVDAMDNDYLVSISVLDVASGKFAHSDEEFMGNASSSLYMGIQNLVSRFVNSLKDTGAEIVSEKKRIRKGATIATGIHVEAGLGGTLYIYENYKWKELSVLWDNDTYDIQIDRPNIYKLKLQLADGSELFREVEFSKRGVVNIDFSFPPEDFKIDSITGTTISLSWTVSMDVSDYAICYFSSDNINNPSTEYINKESGKCTINGLNPNTDYTFCIYSRENYIKSAPSMISTKTSDLKIKDITIKNIGTEFIVVNFQKPEYTDSIRCKLSLKGDIANASYGSIVVHGDDNERVHLGEYGYYDKNIFLIEGLLSETTYYLWIFVKEDGKEGIPSECIKFTTQKSAVGNTGEDGGIIFYDKGFYSDGWRYLEVAPKSEEFSATWGEYEDLVYCTGKKIGTGKENTDRIQSHKESNQCSHDAASRCLSCTYGGKNDWFLPSIDELELIYKKLYLKGLGDFSATNYWSSTEKSENSAYGYNFKNGHKFYCWYGNVGAKGEDSNDECLVRPIRAY